MTVIINGSNTPTAGGVTYGDGTQYATTSAGTSGQSLLSAGSSAPTWGTPASATTATNLAGGAQGSVPYQSSSGTTSMLAAGTNGQVLTSAGAGANPTWTTPNAGSYVYLSTVTASSSAELAITSGINSTYSGYVIQFSNLMVNTGSNIALVASFSSDGGANYYVTPNYQYSVSQQVGPNPAAISNSSTAYTWQLISSSNGLNYDANANGISGQVCLINPSATSYYPMISWNLAYARSTTEMGNVIGSGSYTAAASALNAIKFYFGSGNVLRGTIKLYGIKGS